MDWNALLDVYRAGVDKFPEYDGLNFSRGLLDPVNAIIKLVGKTYWSPRGPNWGNFESPETEGLIEQILNQFDEEKRLADQERDRAEANLDLARQLRKSLLETYGIEVGGGLGEFAGQAWRIGLMGNSARDRSVTALLGALRELLA